MVGRKSLSLPSREQALPGRSTPLAVTDRHAVLGRPILQPFPAGHEVVYFGMGCFWGAERCFWALDGVYTTAVGYAGGYTRNPDYEEVCSGLTGHTEAVLVVYDPAVVPFTRLLEVFWQSHDPTQGMRQGADVGTQYRSAVYCTTGVQLRAAEETRDHYQQRLSAPRFPRITTEIARAGEPASAPAFYYAEDYHQQYLAKNPGGYCGLGGCGVPY